MNITLKNGKTYNIEVFTTGKVKTGGGEDIQLSDELRAYRVSIGGVCDLIETATSDEEGKAKITAQLDEYGISDATDFDEVTVQAIWKMMGYDPDHPKYAPRSLHII